MPTFATDTPGSPARVSVVVPTYKEAQNLPLLLESVTASMQAAKLAFEIVIVDDDSRDGTDRTVTKIRDSGVPVRLHVRVGCRDLSTAVLKGIDLAEGEILVVMDADLSHPPSKIPELVAPIMRGEADFVIGSRYVVGGSAPDFSFSRKVNARVAALLARPLTSVKDPLAGFFAFPRRLLNPTRRLSPLGFKIGLELMVKASPRRILEIGICFRDRHEGTSKLSVHEQLRYLKHLGRLYRYRMANWGLASPEKSQ